MSCVWLTVFSETDGHQVVPGGDDDYSGSDSWRGLTSQAPVGQPSSYLSLQHPPRSDKSRAPSRMAGHPLFCDMLSGAETFFSEA